MSILDSTLFSLSFESIVLYLCLSYTDKYLYFNLQNDNMVKIFKSNKGITMMENVVQTIPFGQFTFRKSLSI